MSVSIFLIFQKVEIADLVVDGTDGEALVSFVGVLRTDIAALEAQAVCVLGRGRENSSRPIAALKSPTVELVIEAIARCYEEQLACAVTEENPGDSVVI